MARSTVHDVARAAGVSLSTVDRVLNGRSSVRRATRERVEEAMRALNYVRNSAAANLSRGRSFRFLFLLPTLVLSSWADATGVVPTGSSASVFFGSVVVGVCLPLVVPFF